MTVCKAGTGSLVKEKNCNIAHSSCSVEQAAGRRRGRGEKVAACFTGSDQTTDSLLPLWPLYPVLHGHHDDGKQCSFPDDILQLHVLLHLTLSPFRARACSLELEKGTNDNDGDERTSDQHNWCS